MNYEKGIFKMRRKSTFIFLISSVILLVGLSASATDREFSKVWKVDDSPAKKWNLDFFQGDSIGLDITSTQQGSAFDLTGATVVWEVRGWEDYTNLYAVSTGVVNDALSGTSRFELTPTQTANLAEGTYLGYAKAIITDGTNITDRVVLAYHRIKTEWSAVALDYDVVGPLPSGYATQAEVAALSNTLAAADATLSSELGVQSLGLVAVSGRVDQVETDIADLQSATNTLNAELETLNSSFQTLETAVSGNSNVWNLAETALQSYTETDPAFSAWDKDYSDLINTPSIPTQYTDALAVAALADELAAKADLTDFQGLEMSVAGSSNDWNSAFSWGNHALFGYLTSYTETDPAFLAWDKDYGDLINTPTIPTQYTDAMAEAALADELAAKQDASTAATDAELSAAVADAPNWATAYAWGNHALAGYLTSYTETDPAFLAWDKDYADLINKPTIPTQYTDALAEAALADELAEKVSQTDSTYTQTVALAAGAVPDLDSSPSTISIDGGSFLEFRADTEISFYDYAVMLSGFGVVGSFALESDPIGPLYVGNRGYNDARYASTGSVATVSTKVDSLEDGTEDFEGLTLDSTIDSWDDIGLTFSNAVQLNAPIVFTNDATWTGWTTTGSLSGTNIVLDSGEYLLSLVQPNGIADYDIAENGTGRLTWSALIVTNGVSTGEIIYQGTDGQLMITNVAPLPTMGSEMTISRVKLTGYENPAEAETLKYVSNLRRIDQEYRDCDLTRKIYVDEAKAAAIASASASLSVYAADADKTVRGAQLRLGNMWVVSPADASGDRFIVSGGEISGDGELVGTTNEFVISKNDYPLMSFTSSASGLYVTNHSISITSSNVTVSLYIATNGVTAAPFAEYSESLLVGEWSRVIAPTVDTYPTASAGAYELTFTLPLADTMYFRAMQAVGESTATINTDVFFLKYSKLLINDATGGVWRIAVSTNGTIIVTEE